MPSPLESTIKAQVASAFRGRLISGTIQRDASSTVNTRGDPVTASTSEFTFEGTRDAYSSFYRAQAGVPDEDVQFLVLLGSVKPVTTPLKGDRIKLSNTSWYEVRRIPEIDPAGATAKCQCFPVAT